MNPPIPEVLALSLFNKYLQRLIEVQKYERKKKKQKQMRNGSKMAA